MTGWSAPADAVGGLLPPFFNRRIERGQWSVKGRRQEISEAERGITFTRYIPGILHCSLWGSGLEGMEELRPEPSRSPATAVVFITSHDGAAQAELRSVPSFWVA